MISEAFDKEQLTHRGQPLSLLTNEDTDEAGLSYLSSGKWLHGWEIFWINPEHDMSCGVALGKRYPTDGILDGYM